MQGPTKPKPHQLEGLRLLRTTLANLAKQRDEAVTIHRATISALEKQQVEAERRNASVLSEQLYGQIAAGNEAAAQVDRDASVFALAVVLEFFDNVEVDGSTLRRLGRAFHLPNSPLLSGSPRPAHGQIDAPLIQQIKGEIAAVFRLRMLALKDRKNAQDWVARNLPDRLMKALAPGKESGKAVSGRTIYSWYEKCGKRKAEPSPGREGYLLIVNAWTRRTTTEEQLKAILRHIDQRLA